MNVIMDSFWENSLDLQQNGTLLFYKGIFSYPIIVELSQHVRNDIPFSATLREKIFSIFIELAQNVSSYSEEQTLNTATHKKFGSGCFQIVENSHFIYLNTINPIPANQVENIYKRIEAINKLDRRGLRELKMNFREQAIDQHTNSGNVGLVEVALKSANQIHLRTFQREKTFISITAKIAKH